MLRIVLKINIKLTFFKKKNHRKVTSIFIDLKLFFNEVKCQLSQKEGLYLKNSY